MSGVEVLEWLVRLAFVGLAVVAIREWWRTHAPAAGWMALTFAALGAVVVAGLVLPEEPAGVLEVAAQRLLVAVLLLFPYLLFRFTVTFERAARVTETVVGGFTLLCIAATFALPDFPADDEPMEAWFTAYIVLILAVWAGVSLVVATRLWTGGRGEPELARKRLRLLAGGALAMAGTLVVGGTVGGGDGDAVAAGVQAGALLSAVMFYAGYAPPPVLRTWWRRPAEADLRRAELELIAAATPDEVAELLLPRVQALVGARQVALVEAGDRDDGDPEHDDPAHDEDGSHRVDLPVHDRVLRVWTSPYAPLFGDDELAVLRSLGAVANLALQRSHLLERERRAREDAERTNTELEQFAYVTSHDLKEPLQVISGFASVLADRYRGRLDDTADRYLEVIGGAAARMQALIDDLLALSRIGRAGEEPEAVPVGKPLEEALANLRTRIEESKAAVEVDEPLPVVLGDSRLLVQLFQNLVSNAIKYSGGRVPRVRVTARSAGDEWVLSVSDNGEGIDPRYHERIFEPFRRLHGEEGPEGTGIGLAIVRKIVDLHGGRIWVESSPGGGADFLFTMPAGA